MDWQLFAAVAVIVQAIALIVTAILIYWQVREQTRLARMANAQQLVDASAPYHLLLMQDREVADLWVNGADIYETMDTVKKHQYRSMLIWWLIFHENIYFQWKNGLLGDSLHDGWLAGLRYFVVQQRIWDRWPVLRKSFHEEFGRHVDDLIRETQPTAL